MNNSEKVELILIFGQCNRNSRQAARVYADWYSDRFHPQHNYVYRLLRGLNNNGQFPCNQNRHRQPRPNNFNEDSELQVMAYIRAYPQRKKCINMNRIYYLNYWRMLPKSFLLSYLCTNSLLSSSVDGLAASLYPFSWQHTLVSVLPSQVISVADFIQAPTPYIIGLLKTENQSDVFSQLSEIDQVFIFDLDTNKVLRKVKDEYSVIPSRIAKGLKNVIGLKVDLDQSTKAVLASEALIRLFIELIGHYRSFMTNNSGNPNFQKQLFINAGTNTAHRNFLEWFTETAMFTKFINDKMGSIIEPKDVFEQRCDEFSMELSKIKHKSKTLQSMKALGDRLKDWAVS